MTSIDRIIFEFLYNLALSEPIIRFAAIFFGNWLGYLIAPAFLLWAIILWRKSGKLTFLTAAGVATVISRIGLELMRLAWDIQRPFVELGIAPLFEPLEGPSRSMPSGHATLFFALAAVAWGQSKKISLALFVIALVMGIGRVAAGVHWMSDILIGALLGAGVGYFVRRIVLNRYYPIQSRNL